MIAVRERFLLAARPLRRRPAPAARRPVARADELVANVSGGDVVNGLAVTANPDSSYTAVWAETANPEGIAPPGRVLSSDRGAGDAGDVGRLPARRGHSGRHPRLRRLRRRVHGRWTALNWRCGSRAA